MGVDRIDGAHRDDQLTSDGFNVSRVVKQPKTAASESRHCIFRMPHYDLSPTD
jgi:hypothetical protein